MKLVFLDCKTIGEDLNLERFADFGEVKMYPFSTPDKVPDRVRDADILILNKVPVNEQTIGEAKNLKLICVTATGTDNLDKAYLKERKIAWRNVAGYSTDSVAQHTFAMLFYLYENLRYYDDYVKRGYYIDDKMFTHFDRVFYELSGKTWGIIGLGAIGKRVAQIATCFGCRVQYYSTSGKNHSTEYKEVDFESLLFTSDIISIHAPLNENTLHLMDEKAFLKMKKTAYLINVGRGPIIVEEDLKKALSNGEIAGAALDVLGEEPMKENHPLKDFDDSGKLVITPHIAWASKEARIRLMDVIYQQVKEFIRE